MKIVSADMWLDSARNPVTIDKLLYLDSIGDCHTDGNCPCGRGPKEVKVYFDRY